MTHTLIPVAPTGAESSKADVPALPVTLDELETTAKECQELGAAVVHVHVRDGETQPTLDPVRLRDTVQALRTETDLIVQLSTGGAVTDPETDRLAALDAEPDAASCSMGTVNFGRDVFLNRWDFIVELHTAMRDREIVPEYEIFDLGQMAALQRLLDRHGLPYGQHVHADLVMGVPGGMPGTAAALIAAVAMLPAGATFAALLAGGGNLGVELKDDFDHVKRPARWDCVPDGWAGRYEWAKSRTMGTAPSPALDSFVLTDNTRPRADE